MILTICGTGIRVSELKFITVDALKSGKVQIHLKGKDRTILLPQKLRGKLDLRRLCPLVYPGVPLPQQLPDAHGHQLCHLRHRFLFSRKVIESTNGWVFHLLTEDIEFSVNCALKGQKIGYCDTAVLYDEQPITFRDSWNQRFRWAKGFYQVFWHYGAAWRKASP